ncbi:DgkA Diacylglycerol kinase [Methylophilaceae bacterium]|jgi:diacylglycerol kinase (ATP)|nr:diacylglycerol kinase [Candidatus Methylopumilus sp.]
MNKIEESPFKGKTGIPRLINAFGYSVDGFKAAFKNEDAFRQELFLAAVLVPLGLYLGKTGVEKALLVSVVLLVLIVELFNSAIEAAVDHTSIDVHPLAKRAKDIASASVIVALAIVIGVWALVLFG